MKCRARERGGGAVDVRRWGALTLCGALALVTAGCAEDEAPVTAATPAQLVKKQTDAPVVTEEAAPQFSYSPVGKRDPFFSYLAEVEATNELETQRRREPTESFELDQYRLTGLVTGTSQPRAMVEDPEGKGHVIKIGARLGKRGGVVTRINTDAIVVTEEFRTPTGDKVRVPITIKLPQPEREMMGQQ